MSRARSPRILDVVCGGYFGTVFVGAWVHASTLTRPWYDAELSRWLYTAYLLAGAVLLSSLFAVSVVFWALGPSRSVVTSLPASGAPNGQARGEPYREPILFVPKPPEDDAAVEGEIDDLLERISEIESEETEHAMIVVKKRPVIGSQSRTGLEDERMSAIATGPTEYRRAQAVRTEALSRVRGPMIAAALFVALAAAMLPGVDGMLVAYHQLNTALLLGLAYGWAGLGAYVALAIRAAVRPR